MKVTHLTRNVRKQHVYKNSVFIIMKEKGICNDP